VAITYTKGVDAAASVVKEIERAGRKAIAIHPDATDARRHGADREDCAKAALAVVPHAVPTKTIKERPK